MSSSDDDLASLVGELVTTLQRLETEFEPRDDDDRLRPPTPRELMRLTSDVAIPATILLLRTNIEALKLLQRALRMADGRAPTADSEGSDVRARAERLSATTLSKLDGALADLQDAVEGQPTDDEARELLTEARRLRADIESRIEERSNGSPEGGSAASLEADGEDESEDVPVDVDAELRSLKDDVSDQTDSDDDDAS
ncbi:MULTISPECIES: DUF7547 family protein [Halomicrobium]|uniref:Uncharacterized protein n=2 Tax=Halomicrobium mukohataei TaxID=57705 RepID=C7NXG5_HALMD|nr:MULTISPECIES: hypothetical protein [Halomicrobium]ACV48399.1 conserved hypothetical protein [Halomicrobium mukohataei DSM 12286]QCD66808.1 hypothetical protein E5139_14575 [Halomicrobium mukohataei]QFR21618.1 hypothetical protein GBQ70_14590 [Halomicrobium sp. ZPS1]